MEGEKESAMAESSEDFEKKDGERELTKVEKRNILIYKVLKQICIMGIWFAMGLFVEVVGPTLPDLAKRINVNYEEIARALSTKAIGLFLGSLFGGFLHEIFYLHTDLIMALGIMIGAVGTCIKPWAKSLNAMALLLSLTGVAEGVINTGGNTLTMHLWGDGAASPMHSVHFGFGLGAIIAPQIVRPYLVESIPDDVAMTTIIPPDGNVTTSNPTGREKGGISKLEYPYVIIACVTTFMAILMLVFYVVPKPLGFPKREVLPVSIKTLLSPGTCSGGRLKYGTVLLIALFLYFLQAVGGERAYGKYLPAFSQESSLGFTKAKAADLASTFWACHVSGRFFGIVVSKWVPTWLIILIDAIAAVIITILLASFGYNNSTGIWVLSGMMGFSISLFFPCGMSWANLRLEVNSMATMVFLIGGSAGGLIYQYLPGYLIQTRGPRSLMYVMVGYACLMLLTFGLMNAVVKFFGQSVKVESSIDETSGEDSTEKSVMETKA